MKTLVLATAALALALSTATVAFAESDRSERVSAPAADVAETASTAPTCTSADSPLAVLAGSCELVAGVSLYGDIDGLASIPTSISVGGGVGGMGF